MGKTTLNAHHPHWWACYAITQHCARHVCRQHNRQLNRQQGNTPCIAPQACILPKVQATHSFIPAALQQAGTFMLCPAAGSSCCPLKTSGFPTTMCADTDSTNNDVNAITGHKALQGMRHARLQVSSTPCLRLSQWPMPILACNASRRHAPNQVPAPHV
jgi:hypothetical protein